jgi:cytochrome c peroxidase
MRSERRQLVKRTFVATVAFLVLLAAASEALSFAAVRDLVDAVVPLGLPQDLWENYIPRHNRQSAEKIELGRKLFFDKRLSRDGSVSCATCHDPEKGFADGRDVAQGIEQRRGTRNSPTLLNVLFNSGQFWDGRADSLEDQATLPLINPLEMGNSSLEVVTARLKSLPEYRVEFRSVFGSELSAENLARAIASYERTLVAADSDFDRFFAGDQSAISDSARRGFAIFRGKGRCSRCHTFSEQLPFFSDFAYHNTGVAARHPNFERLSRSAWQAAERPDLMKVIDRLTAEDGGSELGRMSFSYQVFDLGAFRTPSLRNVAITAPYFHDGSAKTLAEVVRFYNEGGKPNLNREWDLNSLALTQMEEKDLVAFLESLTGRLPSSLARR